MPEPRGPQHVDETPDPGNLKPKSNIDQEAPKQSHPGDRDRYPDPDKRAQDKEDHRDDRDALEDEIEHDEDSKDHADKQAGQMLENPRQRTVDTDR